MIDLSFAPAAPRRPRGSWRMIAAALCCSILPSACDRTAPRNPLEQYGLARPIEVRGEVVERLSAGSYLYLKVHEPSGAERWVATLTQTASSSNQVVVTVFGEAASFASHRLGRTFAPLSFGAVRAGSPAVPPESP